MTMPCVMLTLSREENRTISVPKFKAYLSNHGWKQDVNSVMWRHESNHAPLLNMDINLCPNGESHIQKSINALSEFEKRNSWNVWADIMGILQ